MAKVASVGGSFFVGTLTTRLMHATQIHLARPKNPLNFNQIMKINSLIALCIVAMSASAISPSSRGLPSMSLPLKSKQVNFTSELKQSQLLAQGTVASPKPADATLQTSVVNEALSGFVVSLATLPKAIAFSTVLGLSPLTGIWTTVAVSLAVTVIGQSPGLISGVAGVLIMPMAEIMKVHGPAAMSAAVILSGVLEILFGVFKLGKYLDIVTENVVVGFLNAVVVFLLKTQVSVFKGADGNWLPAYDFSVNMGLALLCAAITFALPKVVSKPLVPPSLVGLVVVSALAIGLKLPVKSLADSVGKANFVGGLAALPKFTGIPKVSFDQSTLTAIGTTALGAAIIAVVETVIAQKLFFSAYRRRVAGAVPDDADRGSIGLGVGNILSAVTGGFGGCGLIPNTMLNGGSGGVGFVSSYSFAASLALAVLVFSPVLGLIPTAALAGVMLTVAVNTMEWKELQHLVTHLTHSKQDVMNMVAMLVTTALCYKVNMGLGVVVGVALTQLLPTLSRLTQPQQRARNDS